MRGAVPAALVAALAVACGSREEVDPCEARLRALEARLTAATEVGEPSGAPPDVDLPAGGGAPIDPARPLLVVSDEVVFANRGVGGLEDIEPTAETLRADLAGWASTHDVPEGERLELLLWAAPDVRVDALVRLLRHAPVSAALLVRGEAEDADEPAWVEEALRAPEGNPVSQRAHLDEAWARATRTCPRAGPHLPLSSRSTGPLGTTNFRELIRALRACQCEGTDLVGIEAVARRGLIDRRGPLHRLPATLLFGPADGPGEELVFGPEDDVTALVERLPDLPGLTSIRAD